MFTIAPLQPHQAREARHLIYTVAHDLFHKNESLEETISRYEHSWPLADILDYQQHYVDKGGTFLAMIHNGCIIATGALRRHEVDIGEIKRVWLQTSFQGHGLGYRMMTALLKAARQHGYAKVWLETAPAYQPRAYAFYHRMGFQDIQRYGDDPDDIGMEFVL